MGTLYIIATPIGNLDDITIRAVKTLFSVDFLVCEDTRHTGQLIESLKLKVKSSKLSIEGLDLSHTLKFISFYDEIASLRIPEVIDLLHQNFNIALVSDAGTPLVADPGFKLVKECIRREIKVESIPGPSSIVTALTLSGLPPNNFLFLGYPPSKSAARKTLFTEIYQYINKLIKIKPTVIFLESPHRIQNTLIDLKGVFGDIEVVIARELTKINEEIYRGKISQALTHFQSPKGEIVILF